MFAADDYNSRLNTWTITAFGEQPEEDKEKSLILPFTFAYKSRIEHSTVNEEEE